MKGSRYVKHVGNDSSGVFLLTVEGREYYEQTLTPKSGVVFVIASCHGYDNTGKKNPNIDKEHQGILHTLRYEALEEYALATRFQEFEEQEKNIYLDIFDYIDSCEFVIADITFERPSCYIEIG